MNAKYALALILTLQVSMSLCEVPTPSAELLAKYDAMKSVFYKRLLNAYSKLQAVAAPMMEDSDGGTAARDLMVNMQANSRLQAAVKVVAGLGEEAIPLVDKARSATLGAYERYFRPHIGGYLDTGINHLKVVLDQILPAE